MTGEKNRYKTHVQLWKLDDKDLKTPAHDELVLQLLSKNAAFNFIKVLGYNPLEWQARYEVAYPTYHYYPHDKNDIKLNEECFPVEYQYDSDVRNRFDEFIKSSGEYLRPAAKEIFDEFCKLENKLNVDIKSEVPIISGSNKFIIGYIDIRYNIKGFIQRTLFKSDTLCNFEYDYQKSYNSDIEHKTFSIYPRGEITIYNYSMNIKRSNVSINVEVKPKIDSFGETLRQINTYKTYLPDDIFVIYSPDTRFKEAFETQGIKFITPSEII